MKKLSLKNLTLNESNMLSGKEKKETTGGAGGYDNEGLLIRCKHFLSPDGQTYDYLAYLECQAAYHASSEGKYDCGPNSEFTACHPEL